MNRRELEAMKALSVVLNAKKQAGMAELAALNGRIEAMKRRAAGLRAAARHVRPGTDTTDMAAAHEWQGHLGRRAEDMDAAARALAEDLAVLRQTVLQSSGRADVARDVTEDMRKTLATAAERRLEDDLPPRQRSPRSSSSECTA